MATGEQTGQNGSKEKAHGGPKPPWGELRERLGLNDVPDDLLRLALSHPSWTDEQGLPAHECNQRLEFLGDAVLGMIASEHLYRTLPGSTEGTLTRMKSEAVKRDSLASVARRLGLSDFVLLGPQERASGGHRKPSILADCVEALIGAIYLACGLERAREFILSHLGDRLKAPKDDRYPLDPKSELQELVQAHGQELPQYVTVSQEGPAHARVFEVEVRYAGEALARGRGSSKQRAQQEAARAALERREEWLPKLKGTAP
ncbi:MAG: ribonuclease III [Armatimonadetes bacterium]|nr:ribonuclease III [Armatimonadota bacterium]